MYKFHSSFGLPYLLFDWPFLIFRVYLFNGFILFRLKLDFRAYRLLDKAVTVTVPFTFFNQLKLFLFTLRKFQGMLSNAFDLVLQLLVLLILVELALAVSKDSLDISVFSIIELVAGTLVDNVHEYV